MYWIKQLNISEDLNNILALNLSRPASLPARNSASITRKKWECCIQTVDKDSETFIASLENCLEENSESLIGEFSFNDVSFDERKMIKAGSIFYCSLIDEITKAGTVKNGGMVIYFRTIPNWSRLSLLENTKDDPNAI